MPEELVQNNEYDEQQRRTIITDIINGPQGDPITNVCIDAETLQLKENATKRVGRLRYSWCGQGRQKHYWKYICEKVHVNNTELDMNNKKS